MTVTFGFSQTDPVGSFNRHVFESWKGEYIRIGPYKVKGTPYLLGRSFPGSITYNDGKSYKDTKILYDIYNQKAGVEINNLMVESPGVVDSFSITLPEANGVPLIFKNSYLFNKPDLKCFLNVLEEGGKLAFLKIYKTKLVPDPFNNLDKELKVFEQYFEYYLFLNKSQVLKKIKLRRKDIMEELSSEKSIELYTATENIDFSKEADVIKLVKRYNSSL